MNHEIACGLVLGVSPVADVRLLGGLVRMAVQAGVRRFDAVSPAAGKEVGAVLAGIAEDVELAVGTASSVGLDTHKGSAGAVQDAFNGAGVRRAHTLVLPWLPEQWAGELGRTVESLREISLFRQVVVLAAGPDEARRALDGDGVDGVRLPLAALQDGGEDVPALASARSKRLQLTGFLAAEGDSRGPSVSPGRLRAMQELSAETGLGPVDLVHRHLRAAYPDAELVADVVEPALAASLLQGIGLIAPEGLADRLAGLFQET